MSPEIESELREYLREQKAADVRGALDRLANLYTAHDADDKVRHAELQGDLRGLSLRVGALERQDEKLEDKLEKSGSWDREALQAQAHIAREETKQAREGSWISRSWPSVVSACVAVLAIILALVKK